MDRLKSLHIVSHSNMDNLCILQQNLVLQLYYTIKLMYVILI